MKTPRQILLERHQAANRKLDAIRQSVLTTHCQEKTGNSKSEAQPVGPSPLGFAVTLWRELFRPAPRIWAGFAVAWLVIAGFNLVQSDSAPGIEARVRPVPIEVLTAWLEQQEILTELTGAVPPTEIDRPKQIPSKPRSEGRMSWLLG